MNKKAILISIITIFVICVFFPVTSFAQDGENPSESETAQSETQNQETNEEPEVVLPKKITFNKSSLVLPKGKKVQLKLKVSPENAVVKGTYSSSDTRVVKVSQKGKIAAVSAGRATVTFKAENGVKARCRVVVKNVTKSLKLNKESVTLLYDKEIKKGETFQLKYKIDKGAYNQVVFKSADEGIATVSKKGVIVPHKSGKTKIVVKAVGGAKAVCVVKVDDNCDKKQTLNQTANRAAMKRDTVTRYVYGSSVRGRPLEAYIIKGEKSKEKNVIFIDFACHGFEDSYFRDAKVLTAMGNRVVDYYSKHPDELGKYILVAVPCANPDGTIAGKNNKRACKSAFGRCTAAHVDMNRDFGKFRGKESRALKRLFNRHPPDVYLNFHGWLNTSIGTPWLARLSSKKLGLSRVQAGQYGHGYIIKYVKNHYGASVCLVEYRSPKSARKSFKKTVKFINSIAKRKQ